MPDETSKEKEVPPSYDAILQAAISEYAEHGRHGVRIEAVAERAGVNKTLVYRHFGNRDQLFEKALEAVFAKRFGLLNDLSSEPFELFKTWAKRFSQDSTFLRMLLREALERSGEKPLQCVIRQKYYEQQISRIGEMQTRGQLPQDIEPAYLFMFLTSVLVFPFLLPQISELITGQKSRSRKFQKEWLQQCMKLLSHLKE